MSAADQEANGMIGSEPRTKFRGLFSCTPLGQMPSDGAVALVPQWRRKEEDFPNYQTPKIEGGLFRAEGIALF
jgi:hypothetical protein